MLNNFVQTVHGHHFLFTICNSPWRKYLIQGTLSLEVSTQIRISIQSYRYWSSKCSAVYINSIHYIYKIYIYKNSLVIGVNTYWKWSEVWLFNVGFLVKPSPRFHRPEDWNLFSFCPELWWLRQSSSQISENKIITQKNS